MGLGNPGRRYERTRHNLGFLVLDRFARAEGVRLDREKCESLIGTSHAREEAVLLAKPQTFMNRSGQAAGCLVRQFRVPTSALVVVYDDLDLAFGRLRIRLRGSAGGHRGLRSILQHVADEGIVRIRVGIGRPPPGIDPVDYVLQPFAPDEAEVLDEILSRACDALGGVLDNGPEWAMDRFNRMQ